jgi:hypothetical protein
MELFEDRVTGVGDVEMAKVMEWVKQGNATQRKTLNRRITSYGIKHIVERDTGTYISNYACIEGLKQMGFTAKPITGTPNYYFNISLKKQ